MGSKRLFVDKSIELIGNGSATTIIEGTGRLNGVELISDRVKISGFSITTSNNQSMKSGIIVYSDHNHIFQNNCSNREYA